MDICSGGGGFSLLEIYSTQRGKTTERRRFNGKRSMKWDKPEESPRSEFAETIQKTGDGLDLRKYQFNYLCDSSHKPRDL
jgi:hypothetical protein